MLESKICRYRFPRMVRAMAFEAVSDFRWFAEESGPVRDLMLWIKRGDGSRSLCSALGKCHSQTCWDWIMETEKLRWLLRREED